MQRITSTLNAEGGVTIPSEVLERLYIEPGEEIVFLLDENQITLHSGGGVIQRTAGMLRSPPGVKIPATAREIRQMAEEAIAEEALRRMGG